MTDARSPRWHLPPRRVVVGVDFGSASARAAAIAGAIATAFDATLTAVHADRFEPPPYFTAEQIARLEVERLQAVAAAMTEVRAFVGRATARGVEPLVVDEPPVEALLHASSDADLLVLGTHGRRGPSRWWLGSVAERVVRASEIPVLVTRDESSPVERAFSQVVLVGDSGPAAAPARRSAELLVATFRGQLIEGGPLTDCHTEAVSQASLVVLASSPHPHGWRLIDEIADALARCRHPLLFVPTALPKE